MIKVNNLHKSFGKLDVLNGIDEHIKQGEVVVVIGPSGSGKSTFLRCLNLLEKPNKGEIYGQIDGETVTDFIFLSSKITADVDCSHEIKRHLLLGRKVMTNLLLLSRFSRV